MSLLLMCDVSANWIRRATPVKRDTAVVGAYSLQSSSNIIGRKQAAWGCNVPAMPSSNTACAFPSGRRKLVADGEFPSKRAMRNLQQAQRGCGYWQCISRFPPMIPSRRPGVVGVAGYTVRRRIRRLGSAAVNRSSTSHSHSRKMAST